MKRLLALLCAASLGCIASSQSAVNNAIFGELTQEGLRTSARPGGGSYSELQGANTIFGYSASATVRLADNFTVFGGRWTISGATLFGYSFSAAAPSITGATVEIRQGSPTGAVVANGTFVSSTFTDNYRIVTPTPNDDRHIEQVEVSFPNVVLDPGIYFITYGFVAPSGTFTPPLTKVGVETTTGANGFQNQGAGWNPAIDPGSNTPQDFPFYIHGTPCYGKLYALTSSRNLFEVNPLTIKSTNLFIGPGTLTQASLAYDSRRQLFYMSTTSTPNALYQYNIANGNVGLIGDYGLTPNPLVHGIEYDPQMDTLWGVCSASGGDRFFRTSPIVGGAAVIGNTGVVTTGFNNLGYDSRRNVLFMTNSNLDNLYTINRATGAATLVGPHGAALSINGLAFAKDLGVLYGIENNGNIHRINQTTGETILMGDVGTGNFLGLVYVEDQAATLENANITSGTYFGGTFESLLNSDNDSVFIICDENGPNGTIELRWSTCLDTASMVHFKVETAATRTDLSEFLDVFDYNTNTWDFMLVSSPGLVDSSITAHHTASGDHINALYNARTRIRWIPQEDLVAEDGWSMSIDQVTLHINP